MGKVLITGATGNIGSAVIRQLYKNNTSNKIVAGVRDIPKSKEAFRDYSKLEYVDFDFESPETFDRSLTGIDRIFLLRPPHISDVEKYFRSLVSAIREYGINEILFLSVQGAGKKPTDLRTFIEREKDKFEI